MKTRFIYSTDCIDGTSLCYDKVTGSLFLRNSEGVTDITSHLNKDTTPWTLTAPYNTWEYNPLLGNLDVVLSSASADFI